MRLQTGKEGQAKRERGACTVHGSEGRRLKELMVRNAARSLPTECRKGGARGGRWAGAGLGAGGESVQSQLHACGSFPAPPGCARSLRPSPSQDRYQEDMR